MYIQMKRQPARLGRFEGINPGYGNFGDFGQGDTASGVITALGNAINGIVTSITTSQVLKLQTKVSGQTAQTIAIENTKKLQISSEAQVKEAEIGVKNIETTYTGLTKVIVGAGAVLTGLMLAGAFAYSTAAKARGDFEIEYKTVG